MIEVLVKIITVLDKEIAQKEDIIYLKECYRKSLPIIREKFLSSLTTTKLMKQEIFKRSKNYEIRLDGSRSVVSVISIDVNSINKVKNQKDEIKIIIDNLFKEIIHSKAFFFDSKIVPRLIILFPNKL